MGAKQILNKIKNADAVFQIGDERVVVEIKSEDINKGKSFKEIVGEFKKASKENLLSE
ncbi:MAG: hypothetical protein UT63_C0016G0017 [Candidatus Gottesmanbacteria bacterium GW2011_GWC2_39_8]|uniref:Uncharacterized protein n=1 Tax=Candidatus Gottesmanbacteria bacterium GW2011_GWC2_39_8 TaxID=1618450 RepID=A0A0G0PZY3_9BACT|nr:MAG: hypothetical protein UT63_C0016G0017 [Candidatus Gottesmanbacteria bacterium GW2011_GWC2_39_8]